MVRVSQCQKRYDERGGDLRYFIKSTHINALLESSVNLFRLRAQKCFLDLLKVVVS